MNVSRRLSLPPRSLRANPRRRGGFTLVELLVVITIILLLTAATIPVVLPAIASRRASEAARVTQAELANARDRAVRVNAPAGVRLVKSVEFPGPYAGDPAAPLAFDATRPLAYDRLIGIESPVDYKEGKFFYGAAGLSRQETYITSSGPAFATVLPDVVLADPGLLVIEKKYDIIADPVSGTSFPVPNAPVSWFGNLRQGDKFIAGGRTYTIAGPVAPTINGGQPNTERVISVPEGVAAFAPYFDNTRPLYNPTAPAAQRLPQYLILTNNEDDNGNGLVDESFDGINNDSDTLPVIPPATIADGRTDPGFDLVPGADPATPTAAQAVAVGHTEYLLWAGVTTPNFPNSPLERLISSAGAAVGLEYEEELPLGLEAFVRPTGHDYIVRRRPIPVQGATEFKIPGDTLIDATTARDAYGPFVTGFALDWRSRIPIGPAPNYNIDILFTPSGQLLQSAASANSAPPSFRPFYHLWLSAREDIRSPNFSNASTNPYPLPFNLPTEISLGRGGDGALQKERRLLTIFTRTGQILSNSIEFFTDSAGVPDLNAPYQDAQLGAREP